ncbi:DUF535 family protein [Helicobacter cetorum]|uniref:DUF535 domain-containing protein n=1 Tax=Helicobacter cetorum (strain ATCC BAA-540 / CCUG 52418 / MIT 99-5656) TaxID=1163745 RepID=I0ESI3_HELCM|nr:DUF535 family protein [Helicobacter cetorum]AFI05902.1 hypothetical protein HCD_04440 [Helicobacter cetorum MIT 99-5656]
MLIISKSVRFLAHAVFKILNKILPHKIKNYFVSLTLEHFQQESFGILHKSLTKPANHRRSSRFSDDTTLDNLSSQQLESFYNNLFKIINNRIKNSEEEALIIVANIIQMMTFRTLGTKEKLAEGVMDKASLMGIKLRTIESLLPKGYGIINIRNCLLAFCDIRFSKLQKLDFLIHNLLFLQNLQVKNPTTSDTISLLEVKTLTFHSAKTGGGAYHFSFGIANTWLPEGLLEIKIEYEEEEKKQFLYKMKFCALDNEYLLVSCIQGTKDLQEKHYQFFSEYCKTKPNSFLIGLAKVSSKLLGYSKLFGIPNDGQISTHLKRIKGEKCFNYDAFFSGCDGQLTEIKGLSYWNIPLEKKAQKRSSKRNARRKVLEIFKQDLEKILVLD